LDCPDKQEKTVEPKKAPDAGRRGGFCSKYADKTWVYTLGLALIVIVIFSGFIFSDKMLVSSDQLSGLDAKETMRTSLLMHHQFPFWFSSRLGGMPTIDALFGDAFYPVAIVMNALIDVPKAIGFKMVLHVFLAGLFFFLMLRRGFKIAAPVAFAGGVFYMLNPEFFSHIYPGHDGKMYVIAWLPFVIWRLKALADSTTILNTTLLGLAIGISLITSHVQLNYFVLWGVFFYGVFVVVRHLLRRDRLAAVRFGAGFGCAVAIGLAIGLIQVFPSFMYVHDAFSVRGVDRGFKFAASWSLHWPEIFSLWVPEFGNTLDYYWSAKDYSLTANSFKLNSEYAGGIVLLLAAMAVAWKSRPWRWFWLGIAVLSLFFALGAHTPVFHIAYAVIPGVKKFRACSMIMFWFSFSTILLAALFLKDMLRGEFLSLSEQQKKKRTKNLLIALAAICGVTILFSIKAAVVGMFPLIAELDTEKRQIFDVNFSRNFVPMLWLWFFFAAGTLALIIAVMKGTIKPGVAVGIIFVMGFIDVLRVDALFIKLMDPKPYFYAEPAVRKLQREMAVAPFRVFSLPGALPQNGEGIHGLEGVDGFHDNELRWYREFRGDRENRNYFANLIGVTPRGEQYLKAENIDKGNPFLDIANVKYLLARNGSELLVIENRNALGRVAFAPNFTVLDTAQVLGALQSGGYDYRTTVALSAAPSQRPSANTPDSLLAKMPSSAVFWQRYTPNDRIVKVTVPQDGFLRIAEVYYPAWKVMIDGSPSPVYRSDYAWMAVFVPKGEHVVEMKINSLYLGKALLVSFPMLFALCLYWIVRFLRKQRKSEGR
jgi:hypothetical protein